MRAGEVVGLIGPDGAGKTSTLRVLAGLLRPSGGRDHAFGLTRLGTPRAGSTSRVGYLAQRFALYGDLTVDENIQFFALLYGVRGLATGGATSSCAGSSLGASAPAWPSACPAA